MKNYIRLTRPMFLSVTLFSLLVGFGYAYYLTHKWNWLMFSLTTIGALILHLAENVLNDVFDYKTGNDQINTVAIRPFSGGSGVLVEGLVSPGKALIFGLVLASIGAAIGLYINSKVPGNKILIVGVLGVFTLLSYNDLGIKLGYRGLAELLVFITWGPLIVSGAFIAITGYFTPSLLLVSIPPGVFTMLVLVINEFADREADKRVNKRTWAVIFGEKKTLLLYFWSAIFAFLAIVAGILFKILPLSSLLALLPFPIFLKAYKNAKVNLKNIQAFIPSVLKTVQVQALVSLFLAVGLFLA